MGKDFRPKWESVPKFKTQPEYVMHKDDGTMILVYSDGSKRVMSEVDRATATIDANVDEGIMVRFGDSDPIPVRSFNITTDPWEIESVANNEYFEIMSISDDPINVDLFDQLKEIIEAAQYFHRDGIRATPTRMGIYCLQCVARGHMCDHLVDYLRSERDRKLVWKVESMGREPMSFMTFPVGLISHTGLDYDFTVSVLTAKSGKAVYPVLIDFVQMRVAWFKKPFYTGQEPSRMAVAAHIGEQVLEFCLASKRMNLHFYSKKCDVCHRVPSSFEWFADSTETALNEHHNQLVREFVEMFTTGVCSGCQAMQQASVPDLS